VWDEGALVAGLKEISSVDLAAFSSAPGIEFLDISRLEIEVRSRRYCYHVRDCFYEMERLLIER
jgi:hypothetical protein